MAPVSSEGVLVRPGIRVVVAVSVALLASVGLVAVALAGAQPEGTDVFLELEGDTFYIPTGEEVEGIPPELLAEIQNLPEEQRLDALESQWQSYAGTAQQYSDGGSSLEGQGGAMCGGWAYSFDDEGVMIDAAYDAGDNSPPVSSFGEGGQAFTESNPFKVHNNGSVLYMGFANPAPTNHSWKITIKAFGTDITVDSGGDPNEGEHNRNIGYVDLATDFPIKLNFTAQISGTMTADDGWECSGSGWIEVVGENNPFVAFGAALAGLAGFAGVLFNARPARSWRG